MPMKIRHIPNARAKEIKNPYELVYYRHDWSDNKTAKNNKNYWDWEMKYNNFIPSNCNIENLEEYKKTIKL